MLSRLKRLHPDLKVELSWYRDDNGVEFVLSQTILKRLLKG
jgi:hypothetical protein